MKSALTVFTHYNALIKIRGEISWSLSDLYRVADFFEVVITDLLPPSCSANARNPRFAFANRGFQLSGGGRIRTYDLWVMSPASYRAAPPRVNCPGFYKHSQRALASPANEM